MQLGRSFRAWACSTPNALTEALAARRAGGADIIDLVTTGACEHGLAYPNDRLQALAAAAARASAVYSPDPRGQLSARRAIADFYERRGVPTDPGRVILTPGTSVAYLYVLRLLLNPGEGVLVPRPGYPLFDDLCTFAGVQQRFYHMREEGGRWCMDLEDLAFQCTPRTRALMLVSPHNPLGTVLTAEELEAIVDLCRRQALALVFDEVFSEFVPRPDAPIARPRGGPLTVVLNGFSKMVGLPGLKIGWMRVDADDPKNPPFLDALKYACDLFLPVSEIGQAMVAPLLETADAVSRGIADELEQRRRLVEETLQPTVRADGGVYVCLKVHGDEDALSMRALERGVLVHPGHFYDLPQHVVFTCMASPPQLVEGVRRLRSVLEEAD